MPDTHLTGALPAPLAFHVDPASCRGCGLCAADCPVRLIEMVEGHPVLAAAREEACIRCQHCFAVCPEGAISILGLRPEDSLPAVGPEPGAMEALIRGRRSVRRYRGENLDPGFIQHLLEVAWQAPTAINARQVRFTVVDERGQLARLREELLSRLEAKARAGALPPGRNYAEYVRLWREEGTDVLFRGAPHLLIASAPGHLAAPVADCLIALTTFDLLAQAHGLGTVWNGIAKAVMTELVPEARTWLDLPADHVFGYALGFGRPAVSYARPALRQGALVHRVTRP